MYQLFYEKLICSASHREVDFAWLVFHLGGIEMKDLVEIIAKSLVDHPEQIAVTETEEDGIIKIDLTVAPEDMGKVIGKQGRIAKSIRTVVKAAASKGDKKVVVDIK